MAFADDLRFIVKATYTEVPHTQSTINKFENWSAFHHMAICIDKDAVMLCGSANERFNYTCDGKVIKVVEELNDLGLTRSQKLFIAGYKVSSIVDKANKMAGLMLRTFCCRYCRVLWKAFCT